MSISQKYITIPVHYLLSLFLVIVLSPIFLIISILIFFSSKGPILYYSNRIGRNGIIFQMPKFRTMNIDAPVIASHLFDNSKDYLLPFGGFLRRTSLDELPQLFSILKGEMTLVGPRPALFNQTDLVLLRKEKGIDTLMPGVTGWAQVKGRDTLSIIEKVSLDFEYLQRQSFWFDTKILFITIFKVFNRDGVLE